MKISEIVCDRCGKKKQIFTKRDSIDSLAQIKLWGLGELRTDSPQRIDFCENCYLDFISFLEGDVSDD